MDTNRNLLFGVLALELEHITAQQFVAACAVWSADKEEILADILLQRGWLTAEARQDVERLVERKLTKHGGDVRSALGSQADATVRDLLRDVGDGELEQTLSYLAPPAGFVRVGETIELPPGERTHYTRSHMHGRGGLGLVWLAHDQRLHREVALKELRPDRADSGQAQLRFVREAQITGQLNHPNIVPVHELAMDGASSRPYYTMRFIRGQPLNAAIDGYHAQRRLGREDPLEFRRLLQAFIGVCQAIQYAHARGVIHRDLKPANIMLGDFGEVIVLDWGLAKLVQQPAEHAVETVPVYLPETAEESVTAPGQAPGTPEYMAPEQAGGQTHLTDHRTDVYQLGATLFRLITNRRPHTGATPDEIRQHACDVPTPSAREQDPSVPLALDAVCRKAMARAPDDRYQTAAALGKDVERWLADEPVSVHRETWFERAARWARQHQPLVRAAAGCLLTIAVVAVVATALIDRARRAERQAKGEALQLFDKSLETLDRMLGGVSDVLGHIPGTDAVRTDLLRRAAADYQTLAEQHRDKPEVRLRAGRALAGAGDVRRLLDDADGAEQAYGKAAEIFDALAAGPAPPEDIQLDRARCRWRLGAVAMLRAHDEQAANYHQLAEELAAQAPPSAARQFLNAQILASRAEAAEAQDRLAEAETFLKGAETALHPLLADGGPEAARYRRELARVQSLRGGVLTTAGRHREAVSALETAEATYLVLRKQSPEDAAYLAELGYNGILLGQALRPLAQYQKEILRLQEAVRTFETLVRVAPGVPDYHENLGWARAALGQSLHLVHRNDQARKVVDEALTELKELVESPRCAPRYWETLAHTCIIQGRILRDLGERQDAETNLRSALRICVGLLRKAGLGARRHQTGLAVAGRHLGLLLHDTGQRDDAQREYDGALHRLETLAKEAENDPFVREELAWCCEHQADLALDRQQPDAARNWFVRAHQQRRRLPPAPLYQRRLAELLLRLAEPTLVAEAKMIAKAVVEEVPENGAHQRVLGAAQLLDGKVDDAVATLEKIDEPLWEAAGPERDFWLARAYHRRQTAGDAEKAQQQFAQAVQTMDKIAPAHHGLLRLRQETARELGINEPADKPDPKPEKPLPR